MIYRDRDPWTASALNVSLRSTKASLTLSLTQYKRVTLSLSSQGLAALFAHQRSLRSPARTVCCLPLLSWWYIISIHF